MKSTKHLIGILGVSLALVCVDAHAVFFFFIPGSVVRKIGDALTGAEGDNCVSATAKVGDTITANSSNTAVIKSLSGTSSKCQDPKLPIRALLEFNYSFSSKAGIELPEGFTPKELTPTMLFNGSLINAQDSSKNLGVFVSAQPKKPGGDGGVLAQNISKRMLSVLDEGKTSNDEELTINDLHAYRFRLAGKKKGMFGRNTTYLVTILVGKDEYVTVNANCLTDDFEKYADILGHFAYDVKGLEVAQQALPQDSTRSSSTTQEPAQNSNQ